MNKLFIPYIMANHQLIENMTLLCQNGADMIEVGVPFSDPVADGPTIMEAGEKRLKKVLTLIISLRNLNCIKMTSTVRMY